jgi:hypothetical protein
MELISRRMGEEASAGQWHIVRTRAGAEDRAAIGIEKAGMAAYLPVEMLRMNHRGNHLQDRAVAWQPVFSSHLLVRLSPNRDIPMLRSVYGVDDLLRPGGKLTPVADDAVAELKRSERAGLFDLASACRVPDDDAPPPDSRFAGLMARVKRERGSKKRTALLMELLIGDHSPRTHE